MLVGKGGDICKEVLRGREEGGLFKAKGVRVGKGHKQRMFEGRGGGFESNKS